VSSAPPTLDVSRRRNRSRQREQLLAWLRTTDCHPTAAQICDALSLANPRQSLATVYRNLEVLVSEGKVREVACEGGASRYDGNLDPHHHFTCEDCGRIINVDLTTPRGLIGRLARASHLRATRVSIHFYGVCDGCEAQRDSSPSGGDDLAPDRVHLRQRPHSL